MGGVEERRQGEHGPTADRRPVLGRREDCIEAAVVADGTEGGDARLAHERIGGCCCRQLDQPVQHDVADALALTTCPGGDFDDGRIGIGQRGQQVDAGVAGGDGRSPAADERVDIDQRRRHIVIGGRPQPFEGAERGGAHTGIGGAEPGAGRRRVALVPRQGDAAPRRFDRDPQSFSRFVIVVTITAMAKALTVAMTAPTSRARPPLVNRETSRCTGLGA